jgi:hypothetical protein
LEEERQKKLEIEKNFESDKVLKELGGKLIEYGTSTTDSSNYNII